MQINVNEFPKVTPILQEGFALNEILMDVHTPMWPLLHRYINLEIIFN